MTTETQTNSVLNTVKEAFAPVTEAFKNFQNMEVPEAAREFVKKTAGTAKERAADLHAGSEKVTAAIETAVTGSVNEAAQIQSDMVRASGETFVSRAKSTTEYLGKLVADGAKSAQDNFSKVYTKT